MAAQCERAGRQYAGPLPERVRLLLKTAYVNLESSAYFAPAMARLASVVWVPEVSYGIGCAAFNVPVRDDIRFVSDHTSRSAGEY